MLLVLIIFALLPIFLFGDKTPHPTTPGVRLNTQTNLSILEIYTDDGVWKNVCKNRFRLTIL